MPIEQAAADALLSTTRAVRRRLDVTRPVPRSLLLECVELSQQAPTGGNAQSWRWVIVDEPKTRKGVGELCRESAAQMQQFADAAAARDEAHNQRIYTDARDLALRLHEIPALVIPCLEGQPKPGAEQPYYASIYPAVWSFQLAARARHLGTVLTLFHLRRQAELAALLGIPDAFMICAILPVAYTIGDDFKPAKRPRPESIVCWNAWS